MYFHNVPTQFLSTTNGCLHNVPILLSYETYESLHNGSSSLSYVMHESLLNVSASATTSVYMYITSSSHQQGSAEFLGRTHCFPMVKLDPADARSAVLQWFEIKKADMNGGELLACFELFLVSGTMYTYTCVVIMSLW